MMHLRARVLEFISACVRVRIKNFVTLQPLLDFTSKSHYENLRYKGITDDTDVNFCASRSRENLYICYYVCLFSSIYM